MSSRTQVTLLVGSTVTSGLSLTVPERMQAKVVFQVTGTFVATITWQGTVDGTNYSAIAVVDTSSTTGAMATTATAPGIYRFDASGFTAVRPAMTASTSGVATVTASVVEG